MASKKYFSVKLFYFTMFLYIGYVIGYIVWRILFEERPSPALFLHSSFLRLGITFVLLFFDYKIKHLLNIHHVVKYQPNYVFCFSASILTALLLNIFSVFLDNNIHIYFLFIYYLGLVLYSYFIYVIIKTYCTIKEENDMII